jgi:inhibitor of cysteine peptidase
MQNESVSHLTVPAGGTVSITLDSNPSTGYQWFLANQPDPRYLVLLSSGYIPPGPGARIGQGGEQTWTFQALHRGKTTISMKYCRPWDESDCARFAFFVASIV